MRAAVRPAAVPHGRNSRSEDVGSSEHKRGWQEWVRALIVPVAVAVAIAALSPLGDGLRELIFPTRAAISGTVTLRGSVLAGATLELDGRPAGVTDGTGSFVLPGVGNGKHRIDGRTGESYHGSAQFSVARGATELRIDALELRPRLDLGYVILALEETGKKDVFRYDLVLWVGGERGVLRRVRHVSYRLPAPLPEDPIPAGPASASYCYRQQGTLAYEDVVSAPELEAATAMVRLDDGAAFSISAGSGSASPPKCSVRTAKRLRVPANRPGAVPSRATWPPGPVSTVPSSPVGGKRPRIVSVRVLRMEGCETVGVTRKVYFQLIAEGAATYRASSRSGSAAGVVRNGIADISLLMRCTGASDTFTFAVADSEGLSSETYRMAVNTGLRTVKPSPTPT
jgi:hypothetical protein